MLGFLKQRWFLTALLVLIAGGLTAGAQVPAEAVDAWLSRRDPRWSQILAGLPRAVTAVVLILMSFSLETSQVRASLLSPRPVLWASLVNYAVIPLMAWPLASLQGSPDMAVGLMVAASVPCTMAAASVWTRKAGGNDAVSLMVTLLTNGLCFAVTPFWLKLTTGNSVNLDTLQMMLRLLTAVLVPALAGQLLRQLPGPGGFARRHKTAISVVAQSCILLIVLLAACKAGSRLSGSGAGPGMSSIAVVWLSAIGLHLAAMGIGIGGGRLLGMARPERIAVAFASSQKTLPIGVFLATDPAMFGNPDLLGPGLGVPFAVFPMLMYHASQLFIDTAIADRMAAGATRGD